MSTSARFVNNVQLVNRVIQRSAEGLSHADSMKQLPFPGNCMNWNIGHILVYRKQCLGVIDGSSQADPAEFAVYGFGSEPLADSAQAIPLETLLARIEKSAEELTAAFQTLTPEKLSEVIDAENGTTVEDRLHFYVMFHEAYHVGQLEILRELALA